MKLYYSENIIYYTNYKHPSICYSQQQLVSTSVI